MFILDWSNLKVDDDIEYSKETGVNHGVIRSCTGITPCQSKNELMIIKHLEFNVSKEVAILGALIPNCTEEYNVFRVFFFF